MYKYNNECKNNAPSVQMPFAVENSTQTEQGSLN